MSKRRKTEAPTQVHHVVPAVARILPTIRANLAGIPAAMLGPVTAYLAFRGPTYPRLAAAAEKFEDKDLGPARFRGKRLV